MLNRYPQLFIAVLGFFLFPLLNQLFAGQKGETIRDAIFQNPMQSVEKIESSLNQYTFSWYVIASGGGSTSLSSYKMKLVSIGQVFTDTAKAEGGSYKIFSGYISKGSYPYTEVREVDNGQVPYSFELFQNYPNPFNPTTNIRFNLPKSGHVRLDIYNILGRRVTTLVDADLSAGHKLVSWDGKDDSGKEVSSGVYFYRILTSEHTCSKKMLLLK